MYVETSKHTFVSATPWPATSTSRNVTVAFSWRPLPPCPRSVIDLSDGSTERNLRLPVVGALTRTEPDLESVDIDAVIVTVASAVWAQPLSTNVPSATPLGFVVALEVTLAFPAAHEDVKLTVTGDVYGWPSRKT